MAASRSDGGCGRANRTGFVTTLLRRAGGGLRLRVVARWLTGQLQEDVVEGWSTQSHVRHHDACAAQLGGGLLDQHKALAGGWQYEPVGPLFSLRSAAPDAEQRSLRLFPLLRVDQLNLKDLTADAVLELAARPLRDHAAAVDHRNLVRELIRFLQVLSRQQDRRPVAAQIADDFPNLVATSRVETCCWLVKEEHTGCVRRLEARSSRRRIPPE